MDATPHGSSVDDEVQVVQRLLARERLSIDDPQPGRTSFLSHLGAQPKLVPGPWIAHRDLLYALALANLSPAQRTSLARAVLIEHGREFGVGRLRLQGLASGLPMGGTSLLLAPRTGGPRCLYTWTLGSSAEPAGSDWLILRAQAEWALDPAPSPLRVTGLETLLALGGAVVVFVGSTLTAVQIAQACAGAIPLAAHPRYAPHFEPAAVSQAPIVIWPDDAVETVASRRSDLVAVVLVDVPETRAQPIREWLARLQPQVRHGIDLVHASVSGRADRAALQRFWVACERPKVLLTGDAGLAASGAAWLRSIGATVRVQGDATQLQLL